MILKTKPFWLSLCVFLLVFAALVGGWIFANNENNEPTISAIFELDGNRFAIDLPDYNEAPTRRYTGSGVEFSVPLGAQTPRMLFLAVADRSISMQLDQTVTGLNGIRLDFHRDNTPASSGGTEYFLAGVLSLPDAALDVMCTVQGEQLAEAAVDWCVPALLSVTPQK